jgi:hypothetical protein
VVDRCRDEKCDGQEQRREGSQDRPAPSERCGVEPRGNPQDQCARPTPEQACGHLAQFTRQPIVVVANEEAECLFQRPAVLPPCGRILRQASRDRRLEIGRDIRQQRPEWSRRLRDVLHDDVAEAVALEGEPATEHRVSHHPERVEVASPIEVAVAARLFR